MDFGSGLIDALQVMQTWTFLLWFLIGVANGMVFGLLPGLSGSVGIALMIPFTYDLQATEAMALFVAALSGQTFAGSISAILLNTPGTSPNAATTFDGYPLARAGRGGFAIGISATASFLGSLIGVVVLIALFPVMRTIILSFSFPEFTMLGVLGLTAIAVASRGSMLKGLMSGLLGLMISFVGFSPVGGEVRYVFGQLSLFDGISVVAVLIGLFAVTEAMRLLVANEKVAKDVDSLRFGRSQVWEGVRYVFSKPFLVVRSSLLGTGIGIVPAVGGTLASFLAYFQAAKTVKNSRFGRGDPRGVLAPEAANDAKDAGAALPSLAFGIPGSADWAIILGAMVIHGLTPGPNLISESPDVVWVAILVIVLASLISSLLGVTFAPSLIQVTRLRPALLAPVVMVLAVTGAFGLEARPFDVLVAITFGLLGYAMRAVGMPVIPLILGLILGTMVERSFIQTRTTFGGLDVFLTRPLSLVFVILTVAIIGYEIFASRRSARRSPQEHDEGVRSGARPASVGLVGGLGAVAVVALVLATDFREDSRLFPFIVGGLLLLLTLGYVAVATIPVLRRRFGGLIADGGGMEQMARALPSGSSPDEPDGEPDRSPAPAANGTPRESATGPVQATRTEERAPDHRARLRDTILLLIAFGVGMTLFGLAVTVPLVLVLFLRIVGREGWRITLILGAGTSLVLYLLFVSLLRVPLDGGLLLPY